MRKSWSCLCIWLYDIPATINVVSPGSVVTSLLAKQRSGRPRTRPKSLSPPSPEGAMRTSSVSAHAQFIEPLSWVFSPQGLWSETLSDQSLDGFATLLEDRQGSGSEFVHSRDDSEHTQDDQSTPPPPKDAPLALPDGQTTVALEEPLQGQWLLPEDGRAIFEEMKELMELNQRIYELKAQAGMAPPTPGLCEDITSVTRALLRKMHQVGKSSRGHRHDKYQSLSHHPSRAFPAHQAKRLDAQIRRQAIDLSMYPEDSHDSGCNGIDSGVFLYIYGKNADDWQELAKEPQLTRTTTSLLSAHL